MDVKIRDFKVNTFLKQNNKSQYRLKSLSSDIISFSSQNLQLDLDTKKRVITSFK